MKYLLILLVALAIMVYLMSLSTVWFFFGCPVALGIAVFIIVKDMEIQEARDEK